MAGSSKKNAAADVTPKDAALMYNKTQKLGALIVSILAQGINRIWREKG